MAPDRIDCYRIDGPLGTGGMGEVYRAYDEELDRPVAIKLIHAERSQGAAERERFRREARAAAGLSHAAIVQIHRILRWEGRDCIVMELVEGQTLTEVLRQGPPELPRALRLARQIAGALAAAHARGIVHRDLKTENVMVTPDGDAKILDFGLAKRLDRSEVSLTVEGTIVGTLHTMAPEQAHNEEVDHRADLFSFGALLYEMLTGKAPFRGATQRETLTRVVMYPQPPARTVNAAIPEELSDCIDRLLEKDPARRPESAAEVVAVLDRLLAGATTMPSATAAAELTPPARPRRMPGLTVDSSEAIRPPSARRRRRGRALLGIAVLVLLVAVGGFLWYRSPTAPPPPKPAGQPAEPAEPQIPVMVRPSAAVLSFHNQTGRSEEEWLSTAIAELLRTYLAVGDELRIATGERVAEVERDLGPGALADLTPQQRNRLRRNLGVERLIGGTYEIANGLLNVVVQIEDTATGEVGEQNISGASQPLAQLIGRAGKPLRQELGAGKLTPAQRVAVKASFPASDPARPYAEGLASFWRDEALAARHLFMDAAAAAPDHPLPHAFLAEVWLDLGYGDEARAAAQKAFELAFDLPSAQRLMIEALRHQAAGDWDQVIAVRRSGFEAFADDLDAGLRLVEVQIEAERANEALATLDALENLPGAAENPRLTLARAWAWEILGEPQQTRTFAERAAQQAELWGANLLAAKARRTAAGALLDLGEIKAATATVDEAIHGFKVGDDLGGLATAYEVKADVVDKQGDLDGARRLFESALKIHRQRGDKADESRVATNLGTLLDKQGDLVGAKAKYEDAVAVFDEIGARTYEKAGTLLNLGSIYQKLGKISEARARYTEALTLFQRLEDEFNTAPVINNLGELHYLAGELDDAKEKHREARGIKLKIPSPSGDAYGTYRLGRVFAASGDWVVARQHYQTALQEQERLGKNDAAAETRMALAELSILEQGYAAAEGPARAAEEVLRVTGMEDLAALAQTVLARALLGQGKLDEAGEVAKQASDRARQSADRRLGFAAAIVGARLRAASRRDKDVDAALETLAEVAAEADAAGIVLDALDARLAMGEIELAAGRSAAARVRLEALAEEAGTMGVRQIVKQVDVILRR